MATAQSLAAANIARSPRKGSAVSPLVLRPPAPGAAGCSRWWPSSGSHSGQELVDNNFALAGSPSRGPRTCWRAGSRPRRPQRGRGLRSPVPLDSPVNAAAMGRPGPAAPGTVSGVQSPLAPAAGRGCRLTADRPRSGRARRRRRGPASGAGARAVMQLPGPGNGGCPAENGRAPPDIAEDRAGPGSCCGGGGGLADTGSVGASGLAPVMPASPGDPRGRRRSRGSQSPTRERRDQDAR